MTLRVEQVQAKQSIASAEESSPAVRPLARPAIAAVPNPTWQRLSSGAPLSTGMALDAPTAAGAGLRTVSTANKRLELASAEAQLQARSAIAEATLATIDPEHRAAVAAVFEHEIAAYTAYRNSLVG